LPDNDSYRKIKRRKDMKNVTKLTMAGILVAFAISCSTFYIPIGASKCFPVQHFVNVFAGSILGPLYGVGMAFVTSLIRVFMGTGTLLAFPGSMIGALMAGIIYKLTKKYWAAAIGEVIGTGLLGALAAYFVSILFMGREAAIFGLVIPFGISSLCGAIFALVFIEILQKTKLLEQISTKLMKEV